MLLTRAEHVEIDGVPLATPAWEVLDASGLYDAPPVRGEDLVVPHLEGAVAARRVLDARRVTLGMVVYGDRDPEGAAYADPRAGLVANLDLLKRAVVRPVQSSVEGTRALRHHLPGGAVRSAPCHVLGPLQLGAMGPASALATLDVVVPGGVLRDEVATVAGPAEFTGAGELVVANPGSADQFEVVLELSGTATSVRVRNTTWDPSGGTWLELGGSLGGGVVIDTGAWTAVRDGLSVVGLVAHAGHERWLPLVPGDSVLRIEPEVGDVALTVTHHAGYL